MGPEISQFLSGMRKTMEQVVLPNLTDRFAQEQAGMVTATLGFLELIHDKVFHYELLENQRYKQMLGEALALLEARAPAHAGLAGALAAIRQHLQFDPPHSQVHLKTFKFLRASNERMKELLCELIRLAPDLPEPLRGSFDAMLKPFLHEIEQRERSWFKSLGFDTMAARLPEIGDLLYQDGRLRVPEGA
jgi:hypothetical protein